MFYLVPPAGTPISLSQLFQILHVRASSGKTDDDFKNRIKELSHVKHVWLLTSGRAALAVALQAMTDLAEPARNEVVIPAYTCFSVAAAIVRSGLKIRLVDIDPLTMDYDFDGLSRVDFGKVLAVIACNLFGIVSNWDALYRIKESHNPFLIDDAAQSMGAIHSDRPSGSFGDAGVYSLDRGKSLSTYSGGVLTTGNDELAEPMDKLVGSLAGVSAAGEVSTLVKLVLYGLLLKPQLYWLLNSVPFLGLGSTTFKPNFPLGHLSKLQKSAGAVIFDNLARFNQMRTDWARKLAEPLAASGRYWIPGYDHDQPPVYLRLPVLAPDSQTRDSDVRRLRRHGIVASRMYPSTIRHIPGIERHLAAPDDRFPGAQNVVNRLITLPTHPLVRDSDIKKIVACLGRL